MEPNKGFVAKAFSGTNPADTCEALDYLNKIITNLNQLSLLIEETDVLNGVTSDMPESAKDVCDFEELIELMCKFMVMRALLTSRWIDYDVLLQQLLQLPSKSTPKPQQ